ncbi:MAG: hypothetical protein WCF90_00555 [Methanomicrobiales archaeon]
MSKQSASFPKKGFGPGDDHDLHGKDDSDQELADTSGCKEERKECFEYPECDVGGHVDKCHSPESCIEEE